MAGPPPDLQQAIHAAGEALRNDRRDWRYVTVAEIARVAVEAAWPHVAGQLHAAQADLQQAIQGKIGVDKDQNQLLVDVPGTAHVIADALEQLHAAQAENRELTRQVEWMRSALLRADPRHEEAIREALEQQAAPGQDKRKQPQ